VCFVISSKKKKMLRRNSIYFMSMTGAFQSHEEERATKKGWKDLFFKPQTRDERVKDYVPEVLEESLAAQRAVLAKENTERDLIVEYGQKMLKDLENRAPVTNMFPVFNSLLKLYKKENLVSQRSMHLLMYPGSTQHGTVNQQALPELVQSFSENLRTFIDTVEQNGSYVHDVKWKKDNSKKSNDKTTKQLGEGSHNNNKVAGQLEDGTKKKEAEVDDDSPTALSEEAEPMDITLYVKCLAGMSMANARIHDYPSAIKCCDAALEHAMDPNRKGGVYALKAGLLVQSKKFLEAVETARLAIDCAPQNPQGYLHGSTAYRLMGKYEEAVELLKLGSENMPGNDSITALLEKTEKLAEAMPKQLGEGKSPEKKSPQLGDKKQEKVAQVTE
jgi:tetratricopeptide (TPR) repeat protein